MLQIGKHISEYASGDIFTIYTYSIILYHIFDNKSSVLIDFIFDIKLCADFTKNTCIFYKIVV